MHQCLPNVCSATTVYTINEMGDTNLCAKCSHGIFFAMWEYHKVMNCPLCKNYSVSFTVRALQIKKLPILSTTVAE